ncbi:hypothetical protein D3C75_1326890 [compost metagenome]
MQSLDAGGPYSYHDFRERMADALGRSLVGSQTESGLIAYAVSQFGMPPDAAAEWVSRFLGDLKSNLTNRSLQ